jgi:hypothetical protein
MCEADLLILEHKIDYDVRGGGINTGEANCGGECRARNVMPDVKLGRTNSTVTKSVWVVKRRRLDKNPRILIDAKWLSPNVQTETVLLK